MNKHIDQTEVIHEELSFCNDLELSHEGINVLEYRWFAMPSHAPIEGVSASWRGLQWKGVQQ